MSVTVQVAIERFLDHRRRMGRARSTLNVYRLQLYDWLAWRDQHGYDPHLTDITIDEVRAYFAYLTGDHVATDRHHPRHGTPGLKPGTVRSYYRTLRTLWNWLADEDDLLTPAQYRYFRNNRIPLPAMIERERAAISESQVDALLAACGDGEVGARDRAIIRLLYESGMRSDELCQLHDADVRLRDRQAVVIGKGNKQAVVCWGPDAAAALAAYLHLRRGPVGGPLLRGCSSRNHGGPITPNLIRFLMKRLAKAAGVDLPLGAPVHWFRHGFARACRKRGLTKEEVRDLLRHEDLRTTAIYLGLDAEAIQATHRKAWGVPTQSDEVRRRRDKS